MGIFLIFLFFLLALELLYFKIADKYSIIDKPNHRSSHTKITIRGGGIIFPVAFLAGSFYLGFEYSYFLAGLLLISFISFMDDIKPVSRRLRILFHLAAVALLFYQLKIYSLPFYWLLAGLIFVIGTINAVNFMDGINGITGGFGLVTLITLYYINEQVVLFTDEKYLDISIIALLVFNFFNFRTKAKCFAGDVGSVSLAFIMLFFLLQLIIKTNNPTYVLLLLIYGLDATTTIFFRVLRKENVFEAHRSHFYQYLTNERKSSHLSIAVAYMFVQTIINIIFINFFSGSLIHSTLLLIFSVIVFVSIRVLIEGTDRLFTIKA